MAPEIKEKIPPHPLSYLRNYIGSEVAIRQGSGGESTNYITGKVTDVSIPLIGENKSATVVLAGGRIVPFDPDISSIDRLNQQKPRRLKILPWVR